MTLKNTISIDIQKDWDGDYELQLNPYDKTYSLYARVRPVRDRFDPDQFERRCVMPDFLKCIRSKAIIDKVSNNQIIIKIIEP